MLPAKLLCLLAILALASRPDEGQWLPQQLRDMDWKKLKARGLQLEADQLWHPERGGLLSAAVQLANCTASFVSRDGLFVTNHHCGFGALQQLSTTRRNYLQDGFVADKRTDELPASGMFVAVVRKIEDVTARVHQAEAAAKTHLERFDLVQREIAQIVTEAQKEPNTTCHVASFFEGREYQLYYRTRINDVRLVYSPPRSVGEFGGEVDNWEWPRHTGDFCFFRAYVAPDGTPRAYHQDNVPYQPKHWLRVAKEGVKDGDFVLVMGYPARTERYLSADAVLSRQHHYWPTRQQLYRHFVDVLEIAARSGGERALELAPKIRSLSNIEKAARGHMRGLARNAVHERKLREEEGFAKWVEADPARKTKYGTVLEELREIDSIARETEGKDLVLAEIAREINRAPLLPLLRSLMDAVQVAMTTPQDQQVLWPQALRDTLGNSELTRDLDDVEKPLLTILMEEMRSRAALDQLKGTEPLVDKRAETREMVEWAYGNSTLTEKQGRLALLEGGKEAVLYDDDPLLAVARGLAEEREAMLQRQRRLGGRRLVVGQRWLEAQQAWRGKSFYPDANLTLRVSVGSVTGYRPHDGMVAVPQTTVGGMLEKNSGTPPFELPQELLDAARARKQSRFVDAVLKDVPVCFLADADTTSGNSGSPVLNGRGELVGLNFDRVFEAVAGDYGWSPEMSRNISVDIRFLLWFLDSVSPAPSVLKELGVEPQTSAAGHR